MQGREGQHERLQPPAFLEGEGKVTRRHLTAKYDYTGEGGGGCFRPIQSSESLFPIMLSVLLLFAAVFSNIVIATGPAGVIVVL